MFLTMFQAAFTRACRKTREPRLDILVVLALYMVADMGIAPYDSVAIIIEKLTHQKIPFHKARILSDVVVVIIGIIFATASGAGIWSVAGIGTIINACFNGPLIQFFKTKLERFYK